MAASQQYDALINAAARAYNVDPRLIRAVLRQESGLGRDTKASLPGDPDSPIGIAQMRPSTLRGLLGPNADPNDPATAIMGAAAYLDQGMRVAERAGYTNPGAYAAMYYNGGPTGAQNPDRAVAQYVQNVAGQLKSAGDMTAAPVADPAPAASSPGGLSIGVSPQAAPGMGKVDPKLVDIVNRTSSYLQPGWRAEIISGYRPIGGSTTPTSLHPYGEAVDVQLYGPDGQAIPNYQSPTAFRTYEQFAQVAKKVQSVVYPELNDQFAWGGYFHNGGTNPGTGKLNYGAADLMHLSLGEHGEAGTWEGGLNDTGKNTGFDKGGAPSQGMGPVADFQMPIAPGGAPAPLMGRSTPTAPARPVQVASAGVSDVPPTGGAGPLPENWAQTAAPASMAVAPPSAFTASSPEEQARWTQASTPAGYAALAAAARGSAPTAPAAAGSAAGSAVPSMGPLDVAMLNVPELSLAMPPATTARATPIAAPSPRTLSDEEIGRMQPEDVLGMVGRGDLTDADRALVQRRLEALSAGPGG